MTAASAAVRLRDASSAIRTHDDGTVELVVWRRVDQASGRWNELTFQGATLSEAEAAYDRYCSDNYAKMKRQSERRARWGPLGTGKMT